ALTGGGGLEIANAAILNLGSAAASGLGLTFDPAGRDELLSLGKALGMAAPINDFHTSDKIEFGSFTNITTSFATGTLDVFSTGTLIAALDFVGGYHASDFSVSETGGLVTVTTDVACFLRGTRILTERGEVPVEALRAGDAVLTPDGARTVRWIGRRRIDAARHPHPERVWPVRIRRDAIADGVPRRDLLVSPDHGVFVDGVLMPARLLVNGATIRRDDAIRVVRYFHVELARHALLLADGLWAESYLDTGNRLMFENAGAPMILHPDFADAAGQARRAAGSCAPLARDPAAVEPIWHRLAGRAAAFGHRAAEPATTDDPALRLLADEQCLAPVAATGRRSVFILPRSARHARLVSRAAAPCDLAPWMDDRRRLGVMIRRLTLRRGEDARSVPLDHPMLTEGWWAVERDGAAMWRWTDGDALLPLEGGAAVLEVEAAGMARYPTGAAEAMVAA
ncbi:MAG TPA: Hint domain-containing protein, partial [Acetobacteraceae bacterium]